MIRTAGEVIVEGPVGALLDQEEDPATIPNGCFCMLFYGGKLVDASKLDFPWESIPNQAYDSVFYGNNLLTAVPMLPASTITDRSYYSMFNGCNALTSLSVQLTSWNSTAFNATRYWLKNVSSDGEFWCPEVLGTNETIERGEDRCPQGWTVRNYVSQTDGVEFKCLLGPRQSTVFSIGKTQPSAPDVSLQKSVDGGQTWSAYSLGDTISVPGGSSVKFKAADGVVNGAFCVAQEDAEGGDLSCVRVFSDGGALSVAGDMSLLIDSSSTGAKAKPYQFAGLFRGCDAIVDASAMKLPPQGPNAAASTHAFFKMFHSAPNLSAIMPEIKGAAARQSSYRGFCTECTSLLSAPAIDLSVIGEQAFQGAFIGCTSLKHVPDISASEVWKAAFYNAFVGCTSLSAAPAVSPNISGEGAY